MSEMITKIWRRLPAFHGKPEDPSVVAVIASEDDATSDLPAGNGRYYNREVSDLLFIRRVLEESQNHDHPLLERLRFLAISGSVIDQFYAVRVAKLKRAAQKQDAYITPDGMRPLQQLREVLRRGGELLHEQQDTWLRLKEELADEGIHLLESSELGADDVAFLHHYFRSHVLPVLTPFTIDQEHPFPFVPSGGICAILEFNDRHILIPFPGALSRFVALPGSGTRFTPLEALLFRFWPDLFPHDALLSCGVFQLLRDNDLARQERFDDLLAMVESGLKQRDRANTILLKVSETMSEASINFVAGNLNLLTEHELLLLEHQRKQISESEHVFRSTLPGLATLSDIISNDVAQRHTNLLFEPYTPRTTSFEDCFDRIAEHDVLIHWPYESFGSLVSFLECAARDSDVLAIKQTLYRTSDDSPVVDALIEAARVGKSVTAVIELEARENESSNIQVARRLEAVGAQVIYGIVGLKIHCKATLIVRREADDTVLYSHFSTGNYHPGTAKQYTDLSFFTRDPQLGEDANRVFNYLTSGTLQPTEKLIVAPLQFRNRINELIDNEIANARSGLPAAIYIKVNSLTDPYIIERLYAASEAGVSVDMVVRRHCSLIPGVPGLSSRVRVKSLVGRYLEHSRIYIFANGHELSSEHAIVYIGSPDLMERNLDERVEILVPIDDLAIRDRVVNEIMHANLLDTKQTWVLDSRSEYTRYKDREGLCAQTWFMHPDPQGLGPLKPGTHICTDD